MNTWTGIIGHVGKPTLDGRTIVQIRLELGRDPLELVVPYGEPLVRRTVGEVLDVSIDAEGTITAAGKTWLEPGDYVPGIVLQDVEEQITDKDGQPLDPAKVFASSEDLEILWLASGTLCEVLAHTQEESDAAAAWLDAKITVVAP